MVNLCDLCAIEHSEQVSFSKFRASMFTDCRQKGLTSHKSVIGSASFLNPIFLPLCPRVFGTCARYRTVNCYLSAYIGSVSQSKMDQSMKTLTEQFDSEQSDADIIVDTKNMPQLPIIKSSYHPMVAKPLSGYESIMRRHAAACEAGR